MNYEFKEAGRKLFLVNTPSSRTVRIVLVTEPPTLADFPLQAAKVGVINVDTAGKDVPLSSQEGI